MPLRQFARPRHETRRPEAVDELQRAALERRKTPAQDGAQVAVGHRAEQTLLQAAGGLVGLPEVDVCCCSAVASKPIGPSSRNWAPAWPASRCHASHRLRPVGVQLRAGLVGALQHNLHLLNPAFAVGAVQMENDILWSIPPLLPW
jgi:hypothetical protein